MANKPFAIQGADLTLGGVNLQAGTTGVVIPGVTQAANYFVEEVDENGSSGNQDLGSNAGAITVIDNSRYLQLTGTAPSADYEEAEYSVDELDDGNIEEITVETAGVFLAADKNRAEAANMWATLDPTPFESFNSANWQQIPFRPKMRAGEVENIGGGGADLGNISNGAGEDNDPNTLTSSDSDTFINFAGGPGNDELALGSNNGALVTISTSGSESFKFNTSTGGGSLTFPDGTIQTTAYTGSGGAVGTFFVVVNDDGTVSKSTDGVSWIAGVSLVEGINRVATNGVTVAMIQSSQLSWTTFAGLEASTYLSGSSSIRDQIGGQNISWRQIDYAGGYFVAVGSYTPTGSSFDQGVYGYSTDGRSWTFDTVDQTVVEFFGNDPVDSGWEFNDVDYNGVGWMFSVSDTEGGGANGGGVYITDLTATVTSTRCFSMNITFRAAWNGSAWYMEGLSPGDDNLAGVNANLDPRNGTFAGPIDPWATAIQDLGIDAGTTNELAGGNGYIAASDSDGHVAWSDDNGQTWQIVTPIPYTRTISSITQASPAVVTSSGQGGDTGEKVIISGSSVSGYNGTFYWKDADSSLYTNQALTTPFDTSGLAPFTGTATLTWSNGQYIDAMDYINGYFYIGNDDEQIARSTNLISWTLVDDQDASNFEYWNDIAGFVGTGGTESDRLVNGTQEFTLNTDGSVTFPDGSIQTTAYTGGGTASNVWVQTFESANPLLDTPFIALSVEYDSVGNVIALFYHGVEGGGTYYSVGKYTASGTRIWTTRFDTDYETDGWGLAVDLTSGFIYVAGKTNTNGGQQKSTLTKIASNGGAVEWSNTYAFGIDIDSSSQVVDVALDGNPVMVGYTSDGSVTTTKVDAEDGSIIWSKKLDGQADEEAYGMAVGPAGEVVAVGYMDQLGEGSDTDDHMLVVKYLSDGTIDWQKAILFDEGFDSTGADADIDSEGNVYVCGQYEVNNPGVAGVCMNLVKFNSAGVKQWSRRVEGDCGSIATSIVVGADDKLYLSGSLFSETGGGGDIDISCVVAKYNLDGTVVWQRLLDNIDTLSVSGSNFLAGQGGGSNLAVKQDYVALAGGFGTDPGDFRALITQLPAAGDPFAVGAWDFKASSLTGTLDTGASDITVVDADKTDTDNISGVTVATVTPAVDSSDFLIGTLYSAPNGNESLVNNGNQLILESTGTLTLPQGGTITEGYVTSNPTIQLTPASPDVASQKLVIKGGAAAYSFTDNGININYDDNTAAVTDTLTFSVYSLANASQTLYWWIYPENAGIATIDSGTVSINSGGSGFFTIIVASAAYEFTLRVSPEDNNYDPDNTGVESGLINASSPTFASPYHLHLTTGDLTETSIFLGTDDQNVRTAVNGSIQITTSDTVTNVWEFDTNGGTTFPTLTVPISDNTTPNGTGQTLKFSDSSQQAIIFGPAALSLSIPSAQRVIIQGAPGYTGTYGEGGDIYLWAGPGGSLNGGGGDIKVRAGYGPGTGEGGYLNFQAGDSATGDGGHINIESGETGTYGDGGDITVQARSGGEITLSTYISNGTPNNWQFDNSGALTFPQGTTIATADGTDAFIIDGAVDKDVQIYTYSGETARGWTFGTDGSLQIPGDIKSNGNINIDINLADSTLRRWQFGEDGALTFPDGTSQSTAGGGGASSRTTVSATTATLSNGDTGNLTITGFKGYALYKIETSAAAWVRIYTDIASRGADVARSELTDPNPGSGVIAEVITTSAQTVLISPGAMGFSNESTPSTNIQLAVTNKSGSTAAITVTLTVLQLEA